MTTPSTHGLSRSAGTGWRARRRGVVAGAAATVALVLIAFWPVTTKYGVDYQWSSRRITLFEKSVHFVSRDLQMRRMAAEIAAGRSMDDVGVTALYDWVRANVTPTPRGLHVYDDHVLNILIRGYGAPDQQAEALAVLASYRGSPATAVVLRVIPRGDVVVLTVVQLEGKRVAFDVRNGIVFRRRDGSLADVGELSREPELAQLAAPGVTVSGVPYADYMRRLPTIAPTFARMELQKPWPRLKAEIRSLVSR